MDEASARGDEWLNKHGDLGKVSSSCLVEDPGGVTFLSKNQDSFTYSCPRAVVCKSAKIAVKKMVLHSYFSEISKTVTVTNVPVLTSVSLLKTQQVAQL